MLLNLETIPSFYKNYVKQIDEPDMLQALRISGHRMQELVHSIPDNKADFAYAPGKWTVRELLCHMMDAERIFCYRALRFGRNDKTPLSGFEENDYALQANAAGRSLQKLQVKWCICARAQSISLKVLHPKCSPARDLPTKMSFL
jgi:hypothetical protein